MWKLKEMLVFFSSTLLSSFSFSPLSLFFFIIAWGDFKAFWSCEIKVPMALLVQSLDMVFINPVIYTIIHWTRYLFLIGQKHTVNFRSQCLWHRFCRLYNNHVKVMGNRVKFARFVLLAVSGEARTWLPFVLFKLCVIKQLLDLVFVICTKTSSNIFFLLFVQNISPFLIG